MTVYQIDRLLKEALQREGLSAQIEIGDYNNIVQESQRLAGCDLVIIFWEAANLIEGFYYRAESLAPEKLAEIEKHVGAEIDLVLSNLSATPCVIFNKFTAQPFAQWGIQRSSLETAADQLNRRLEAREQTNLLLVDLNKLLVRLGQERAASMLHLQMSKLLYTPVFYQAYVEFIMPVIRALRGKTKKALVFDCDNTLWGGVVAEDGLKALALSAEDPKGLVFQEVQHLAVALAQRGVFVCLCSKNNPEDVEEVLRDHPQMTLRAEHIALSRVSWDDKVASLRQIAAELKIGLEALVFVDDSPFEVERVKGALPEVQVIQVPERLSDYPGVLREALNFFWQFSLTAEDLARVGSVQAEQKRQAAQAGFADLDSYLNSLSMRMQVSVNDSEQCARLAQLTQKTNQFNLTTQRFTVSELREFMQRSGSYVFSFRLADRFGDYGSAGAALVNCSGDSAEMLVFLLSCRVLGRGAEQAFLDAILQFLSEQGVRLVSSRYLRSSKNIQTENFYEKNGFALISAEEGSKEYQLELIDFKRRQSSIEVALLWPRAC